jgi:hypothetical protein
VDFLGAKEIRKDRKGRQFELRRLRFQQGFYPNFNSPAIYAICAGDESQPQEAQSGPESSKFFYPLHHCCCTRLWTACTQLILQQINHPIFN